MRRHQLFYYVFSNDESGFKKQSMNGLFIRSVCIVRATGIIEIINLTYNLFRFEQTILIVSIRMISKLLIR